MTFERSDHDAPPRIGIGILCKPPRVGLSKTRLAAATGAAPAAAFAAAFLADTVAAVGAACRDESLACYGFFKPADAEPELRPFFAPDVPLIVQDGADLGDIMFAALTHMMADCPAGAVVIGADLPTLPTAAVAAAVAALRRPGCDAVFGPSLDGGYYLGGITHPRAAPLFAPMAWGGPDVMAETRRRAARHGLAVVETTTWYDVDDAPGLARLRADLAGRGHGARLGVVPGPATATRAALARLDAAASP